ncbi:hypothetical protein MMC13_000115 [Lambiella insularis]|nr:hypothetical protein [Lambiella insularis]
MVADLPPDNEGHDDEHRTTHRRNTDYHIHSLGVSKPDNITMAAVALLKSRLDNNSQIARALNLNTPTVGRGLEITAREPFEKYDVERLCNYICDERPAFVRSMREWRGDEVVTACINFLMDGGLGMVEIPQSKRNAALKDMLSVICHVATTFMVAHEGDEEWEAATCDRWEERGRSYGW